MRIFIAYEYFKILSFNNPLTLSKDIVENKWMGNCHVQRHLRVIQNNEFYANTSFVATPPTLPSPLHKVQQSCKHDASKNTIRKNNNRNIASSHSQSIFHWMLVVASCN